MAQETRVIALGRAEGEALRASLAAAAFTPRAVPHARYSFTGEGVTATLYESGKLVLQGASLDAFGERFLGSSEAGRAAGGSVDDERIGTDEAGKGDYFGPLVVASVYVSPTDVARLRRIGVRDSKTLADAAVERIAAAIDVSTPNEVIALDPPEYNRRVAQAGNVNRLLGELHGEAIRRMVERVSCRRVLTDEFGDRAHVVRNLGPCRSQVELEARPRAEDHVAVAAASVLARDRFLRDLKRLSEENGVDLPKGAGDPVDRAARAAVATLGPSVLERVAKVHFRTTRKILEGGAR